MKVYLCKCNNCDTVFVDHYPLPDAVPHDISEPMDALTLVKLDGDGPLVWACPFCLTDGYLNDGI